MRKLLAFMVMVTPYVAVASPSGDCDGTPKEAIVDLPTPLDVWGQIVCTPYGHIISAKEGWFWTKPGGYSPVVIPSQMVRTNPDKVGNNSYFTKIELKALKEKEAEKAIALFEKGFDKSDPPPKAYSLSVTSVSGKSLGFRFFDFGDTAWGMWCSKECKPETRFMLLNMSSEPKM